MRQPSEKSIRETIKKLREAATGQYVWRVQDKTTKAYSIEFSDWEQFEAKSYWDQQSLEFPEWAADKELARVLRRSYSDKLMIKAAKMLEQVLAVKASG